ncbi:MAG: PIG-L family deacetylase [Jatrophihabitantaceae bacterium]
MRATFVVAHPDDETIFFGGVIRRLVRAGLAVEVVCVTSTFATTTLTSIRREEFRRACSALSARARLLPLADVTGRLDDDELAAALERVRLGSCELVFTHGVWGEYGHRHHIQVSRAVHRLAPTVWSLAGPFLTSARHRLGPAALAAKRSLATTAYRSQPFAGAWCTEEERFARWSKNEASALCDLALDEALVWPGRTAPRVTTEAFPDVAHIPPALWLAGHESRCRRLHAR